MSTPPTAIDHHERSLKLARAIRHAELPALYVAAREALAQCDKLDATKEIADQWTAIKSYARQSKDWTLLHYAARIRIRAIRRLGELLAKIPPGNGANQGNNSG